MNFLRSVLHALVMLLTVAPYAVFILVLAAV
ncbi:MAG: 1-acyl-sn-glycerol-3-phosphate acyltransferase, partial [Betaproteobacteria bacterium]|nr:1-acyl-sn-glycerol-3-phosphate acyltransferase [Betaproteobacteria bacterium]